MTNLKKKKEDDQANKTLLPFASYLSKNRPVLTTRTVRLSQTTQQILQTCLHEHVPFSYAEIPVP